jgi:transcriptional regulator with XRE-family HTH domain
MATPASAKNPNRLSRAPHAQPQLSGVRVDGVGCPLRVFRDKLKLSRPLFARLMGCSERTLANWESGRHLPEIYKSRLNELQKLYTVLAESVDPEAIGSWITLPNEDFEGLKPLELIERGETYRIWRMIFLLKPGTAS